MKEKNKRINVINIIIFLIPVISFSFCLFVFFPGIYNYDVFEQLRQIKYNDFNNAHPFISTFYIMIFHKYLKIKCALPFFQILWFSFLWVKICRYNCKIETKFLNICQIIITIFVSFNPMIQTTIISNNKDSLFFLVFLTICYNLQKIIDKKFKSSYIRYIIMGFLLVFFSNIRHNGYYTVLIFTLILIINILISTFKNNKKIIISFILSILVFNYLFMLPAKIYKVKENKATSNSIAMLKAMQFDGYLLQNKKLNVKEKRELSKYIKLNSLQDNFNDTFIDNLVLTKKNKYYYENKTDFLKYNFKLFIFNLPDGLKFYHISSTIVWDIVVREGSVYNCLWYYIDMPNRPYNYNYVNRDSGIYKYIYNLFSQSQINKFARVLLYSPAFYMYLSVLILLILMLKYKYKNIWIIYAFNFINVLIISFSIPIQDTRYLLNNFALGFLSIIIWLNQLNTDRYYKRYYYEKNKKNDYKKIGSDKLKVLLIVPSYNEEDNVLKNYNNIISYNKNSYIKYDAIIINDGSKDKTEEICINKHIPHISLVNNLGIGGAVQTGYKYALENDYDIAVQFDGDGQHDVNYVKNIIDPIIKNECDMVIGSRFVNKESSEFKSSFARRIGINIISFFIKLKTGKKVYDTTSGFRAVNRNIIKEFASDYPVEYPEPISTVEVLKKGYQVMEVPVSMNEREFGTSSIKAWKNIYYMFNVIISILVTGFGGKK